eukprot:362748-Chlamydomonas_euryale.AAC.7
MRCPTCCRIRAPAACNGAIRLGIPDTAAANAKRSARASLPDQPRVDPLSPASTSRGNSTAGSQ